ncbi:NnrS family protein [Rhodomicrobium vannielii]|uniref:NnrS family protein n=1 Tax=Rhodomicrobium vannielii TaxID=1069 RepID=UPI003CCFB4E3
MTATMTATDPNTATSPGQPAASPRGGIPRGLARTGPILFSYGFRPFFLGAGLWAFASMALWIAALAGHLPIGGSYGATYWHAHELLFGFTTAALAGFLLTAVPNWTGRLPVSGWPLAGLFAIWCAGRAAMLAPDVLGLAASAAIDALFLPALAFIVGRELIAGKKWGDLKILAAVLFLTGANVWFHAAVLTGGDETIPARLGVSAFTVMVMLVGGRIIPSFTHNWLNRFGKKPLPVPFGRYDIAAIAVGAVALGFYTAAPSNPLTAIPATLAFAMQSYRLYRWRGWKVASDPLLLILHLAYAFIPLAFAAIAAAALDLVPTWSVLHILTVGVISTMIMGVMTRASLAHTGRALAASRITQASYAALLLAALSRPLAGFLPEHAMFFYTASGVLWLAAFGLFLIQYAPILVGARR